MRPCRVREALGAALALASSEGLEQCQKQSRSMFRFWSRHDRVPSQRLSRDYRASAANRDRPLKMKPSIHKLYRFALVRQSPRREA